MLKRMKRSIVRDIVFILLFSFALPAFATVRLPKLISDGMVLQRDAKVRVWGWSSPAEKVTVNVAGNQYKCVANKAQMGVLPILKLSRAHEKWVISDIT